MKTIAELDARKSILVAGIVVLSLLMGPSARAGAQPLFACGTDGSGNPFCQYSGPVEQLFVNDFSQILFYWDSSVNPLVLDAATSVGFQGVTQNAAAKILIADNPDFAHYFSTYALAAEITGREVVIQMKSTAIGGYLKISNIWLK